jgi:HD-like signal output (HDOD) protein/ActR/RegA family two-component response regulator
MADTRSILIVSSSSAEAEKLREAIGREFQLTVAESPEGLDQELEKCDLALLDYNSSPGSGLDFLAEILNKRYLPVLVLTPPDNPQCAVESIRIGAHNFVVKVGDYYQILRFTINEAINQFNERQRMKQTISSLKQRISELEERIASGERSAAPASSQETAVQSKDKTNIIQEIISRFKRGEVNLPSMPQINMKFQKLMNSGAGLQEIADLLKQDVAISSKLISASNSAIYRGTKDNTTLEQAIGRLGLRNTRQLIEVIGSRSMYTTTAKEYVALMERLWGHSVSCAYACQTVVEILKMKLQNDAFTLGLLHDIGKLVLLQIVGELKSKAQLAEDIGLTEIFSTLDAFHAQFGTILMKRWQFSGTYIQVAMYHDNLKDADAISKDLLVVHFSNLLVKSMGYHVQGDIPEINMDEVDSTRMLKLDHQLVANIKDKVQQHVVDLKQTLL